MEYLSNRKRGKNTRKAYRQRVAKYNRRYYTRLYKFMALYGVFTFDLSEGWSVRLRDKKAKNPNTPYFKEYKRFKYYNRRECSWIYKIKK